LIFKDSAGFLLFFIFNIYNPLDMISIWQHCKSAKEKTLKVKDEKSRPGIPGIFDKEGCVV
jgi:hypothetical protein